LRDVAPDLQCLLMNRLQINLPVMSLQQSKEFAAWGLSKLAVRNIVVFFFACLISAVAYLFTENNRLNRELLKRSDDKTAKVEELKNENFKTLLKLQEAFQKQAEILARIQEAEREMKRLKKKK